jgi:hypothetical protein
MHYFRVKAMRIDTICPIVTVDVECDGYVPLVARFDGYKGPVSWAPKYWRTGDFKRSLLEVAVNPSSGAICKIVLTSLYEIQEKLFVDGEPCSKTGIPSASLSQWSDAQTRIDVEQRILGSLVDRELTVIFAEVESMPLEKIGCDRVIFFIDQFRDLRGFRVTKLSQREIDNLRFAMDQTSYA